VSARRTVSIGEPGDLGIIELYVLQALRGELLLGPYSRYHWRHPGPLYFYLAAPFYWLSGFRTAGLWAAALTINLASFAAMSWAAFRAKSAVVAVTIAAATCFYVWRINALLASQWNPHVLILPTMALVVLSAAVIAGAWSLLPLAAGVGSFAVQTHLGVLPVAAALGAAVCAAFTFAAARADADERRRQWRSVHATLWILAALWFLPLAEEVTGRPGNLTSIWRFFVDAPPAGQPVGTAFAIWADMIAAVVRPVFTLGWGGPIRGSHPVWTRVLAPAEVVLLAAVAMRAMRRRQAFLAALSGVLVLAATVALWSVTRIDGDLVIDHTVFWITGLGALNVAALAAALIVEIRPQWDRDASAARIIARAAVAILFVAASYAGLSRFLVNVDRGRAPRPEQRAIAAIARDIADHMRRAQIPKVRLEIDHAVWDIAAGVEMELSKSGTPFSVADDHLWMSGRPLASTGDETEAVLLSTAARRSDLLGTAAAYPIAESGGYSADALPAAWRIAAPQP
jgi:hypothetical protein